MVAHLALGKRTLKGLASGGIVGSGGPNSSSVYGAALDWDLA